MNSNKTDIDISVDARVISEPSFDGECIGESVLLPEKGMARPGNRVGSFSGPLRSFSGTFVFTIFVVVSCYFLIVTIVNPRGVFWGRSFPEVLPNSRALKLNLLEKYNSAKPVDLVVLGSSRSMRLSPDLLGSLTGQRAFNAGVFSAAPNDYLSLYRVMRDRGIVPKTLVVGLDQESLDPAYAPAPDFSSNLALTSALDGSVPGLSEKTWHWVQLYKQTLTPYYLQNIAQSVWVRWNPRPPLFEFAGNGHEEERALDAQIQSHTYPLADKIQRCEDLLIPKFRHFDRASPQLEGNLKDLLSEATRNNVKLVLWITPLHPETLDRILKDESAGRNFRSAEARLVQIAAMYGLTVRDFTDSRQLAADPNSWYDCVHYNQAVSDRIAGELLAHGL